MSQPSRPTPATRRPARSRKPNRSGQALGGLALCLLAAASIYGGYLYKTSHFFATYFPRIMGGLVHPQTAADVFPGQQAINLMVIGRDDDYNDSDQVIKTHARSDVLMVAHLDFARHTLSLLSIPRDTLARIPGHGVTKINAAHEFGGPALTEDTVESDFGIASDKYVALDFVGFQKAIDQLGGVDLMVDKKMDYDDNWGHLHIHLKPGFQHLNGQQAMGFVRMRHSDSDLVRVQRQQTLIAALKTKLRQPQALAEIGPLLDTIDRYVDSDLSTDQKLVLARFLHDTPRENIQMTTLPVREAGNTVAVEWGKATPVIQGIFGVLPPDELSEDAAGGHGKRHRRHRRDARVAALP